MSGRRRHWERMSEVIDLDSLFCCDPATVLVIGPPDAGKSTLVDTIVEGARQRRSDVGWIDADPGQTRLGLPACIWGSDSSGRVTCGEFVGSLTPRGHELTLAIAVANLKTRMRANGVGFLVIDSPGFVFGPQALEFQRHLLDAAKPQHLLAVHCGESMEPLLDALDHPATCRLPRLPGRRTRTLSERIEAHRRRFANYFRDAVEVTCHLSRDAVWRRAKPVSADDDSRGYVHHLAAFVGTDRPTVVQVRGVNLGTLQFDLLLPPFETMVGSLVVGDLCRLADGQLRHNPSHPDPDTLRAHFPGDAQ